MHVGFHGSQRVAVKHFAGGGSDSARGDFHYGFGGVVERVKNREQGFHRLGQARELHRDFSDQRESAFGADE